MHPFTVAEQYQRVFYLGFSFLIMFTSYNSLQNILSKVFQDHQLKILGRVQFMCLYGAFGVTTLFSSFIVKKLGYKKSFFFASFGYAICEAAALIVVYDVHISIPLIWTIQIIGSIICGISASILWVSQGSYVSRVADENRKSQLFGLFWALMMSSQITGNLLILLVLSKLGQKFYFTLLTALGFISSVLFLFLPNVSNNVQTLKQQQSTTTKQQLHKVWSIITNKKYLFLNIYFWFPGLTVSFYVGFLYKLVNNSILPPHQGQYKQWQNFCQGIVFLSLGVSQLVTGMLVNRFGQKFCKYKQATFGTFLPQLASIFSLVCYFTKSFPLAIVSGVLWGSSQTFLQSNTGGLISKIFPGKVQAFSVYRIFFSLGVVSVLFMGIALDGFDGYIPLVVIVIMQAIITMISVNLKDLDIPKIQDKQSLLSQTDKD